VDFIRNLEKVLAKRKVAQNNRKLSDGELYRLGVIATLRESISEERRLSKVWKHEFYKL